MYERLNKDRYYQVVKEILENNRDQDIVILNVPSENFIISLDCYEYIYDDSFDSVKMEEGWRIIKGDYK
jgi:hypothetical protein